MARSISEEEIQLKKRARRRLVGAVVLVAIVAVVLPMVLDTEPKRPNQSVEIRIPSPDSGPYSPPMAAPPAGSESAGPGTTAAQPSQSAVPAPDATSSKTASSPAPSPVSPEKKVEPSSDEAPARPASAAPEPAPPGESRAAARDLPKVVPTGKFVVQIAALADAAKAKRLQQQVAHGGIKSYTEVVKTAKGPVTRVRAGPYATRDAAEKARAHLKAAGLDGKVVRR
jgi:DedD protein